VLYVNLQTGMRGDAKLVVSHDDTARALGSGTVDVLGSPRLVALCEEACCHALGNSLDPGTTSVGMRIQFDHLQPTPVGAEVVAEAVLEKIDGRRLKFTVSASDPGGLVAAGKITRVVVDLDRFMSKCCDT
jgi:fluoroacetyl-CoA thioesterase